MNISLMKLITMLSCFIGVVCAFLSLLPYIGGVVFFFLICFTAVVVMLILMKTKLLQIESVQESITIGGICGFLSSMAFALIYIPMVILFARVFHYFTNEGVAIFFAHANLFVVLLLSIFMAIFSATINAFTGFVVYYLTELFKNMNNR